MKRLFESIAIVAAVLFAAVACDNKALAPAEPSTPVLQAPGINITVTEVGDDFFSFKIAPQGKSAYYSYLVSTKDPATAKIDSSKLYSVSYKDVAQGTVCYANTASWNEKVTEAAPNTTYYIYAVASSVEGNVGSVASTSVHTSDGVNPSIEAAARNGNIVQVKFTEAIKYTDAEVTAVVYAKNYRSSNSSPVIAKTKAEVLTAGNIAQFTFPEITVPGSWYLVNYPAGTFVDSAGNKCEGVTSSFVYNEKGALVDVNGLYGYLENEAFEFTVPKIASVTDATKFINITSPQMLNGNGKTGNLASVKIVHVEDGVTTTTEYDLQAGKQYGVTTLMTAGFRLVSNPKPGDQFTIYVEGEAFEDIYGNRNAACEIGPIIFSYGYTHADVIGNYTHPGTSGYGSQYDESAWTFAISESDDATKGDVIVSTYYDFPCKIYASWNNDTGELTFPIYQQFLGGLSYQGVYYEFYTGGYFASFTDAPTKEPITLYMEESGTFTDATDYLGYEYNAYKIPASGKISDITKDDYLGRDYNIFNPLLLVKGAAANVAPASIPGNRYRVYINEPGYSRKPVSETLR